MRTHRPSRMTHQLASPGSCINLQGQFPGPLALTFLVPAPPPSPPAHSHTPWLGEVIPTTLPTAAHRSTPEESKAVAVRHGQRLCGGQGTSIHLPNPTQHTAAGLPWQPLPHRQTTSCTMGWQLALHLPPSLSLPPSPSLHLPPYTPPHTGHAPDVPGQLSAAAEQSVQAHKGWVIVGVAARGAHLVCMQEEAGV